jgi:uncharacterized protein (TIGR04255 family)
MGETLSRPPLIEALCEFRFDDSSAWDWTIPGLLYEELRGEFPERSEVKSLILKAPSAENPLPQAVTAPERVQFRRSDGSMIVQVGPHLLVINHLPQYSSWELFLEKIREVYRRYSHVAGPPRLQRIGLRYINRFDLKANEGVSSIVTTCPSLLGALSRPVHSFYQRYDLEHDKPKGLLVHQSGKREIEGSTALMLDIDFGSTDVAQIESEDNLTRWLNDAHDRVYDAFVASINPDFLKSLR